MINKGKTTGELLKILKSTHSVRDLSEYREEYAETPETLSFHFLFNSMLSERGLGMADVVRDSHLDRTYAYQILNGRKTPGRNKVIALSLASGLTLKETNRLLTAASQGSLTPRSSRDSILIYGIEHGLPVMRVNELLSEADESLLN